MRLYSQTPSIQSHVGISWQLFFLLIVEHFLQRPVPSPLDFQKQPSLAMQGFLLPEQLSPGWQKPPPFSNDSQEHPTVLIHAFLVAMLQSGVGKDTGELDVVVVGNAVGAVVGDKVADFVGNIVIATVGPVVGFVVGVGVG